MFSVKHIHPSGEESIYAAKQVRYTPKEEPNGLAAHVWIDAPDGSTEGFAWGSFFVMNENGKTVSRYDLGG